MWYSALTDDVDDDGFSTNCMSRFYIIIWIFSRHSSTGAFLCQFQYLFLCSGKFFEILSLKKSENCVSSANFFSVSKKHKKMQSIFVHLYDCVGAVFFKWQKFVRTKCGHHFLVYLFLFFMSVFGLYFAFAVLLLCLCLPARWTLTSINYFHSFN